MRNLHHTTPLRLVALGLAWGVLAANASGADTPPPLAAQVPELRPGSGYLSGYLNPTDLPRSDLMLPAAPHAVAPGSSDDVAARAAFTERGQPRWQWAARDAELHFPQASTAFACALGFQPTPAATPHLMTLLQRTLTDAGYATYAAKNRYQRPRPFAVLEQASCTPQHDAHLRQDGAYPSGHAAIGWAWALVLSEVVPSQRDALLRRGLAFGQSRVACGVHWPSDVDAGRTVGAAVVAALHGQAVFRQQLPYAQREVQAALAQAPEAPAHCAAEADALKGF